VVVDTSLAGTGGSSREAHTDSLAQTIYVREQGHAPGASVQAGTEIRLFTTTDEEAAMEQREALVDSSATPSD
jgi:hypothetical protein